MYTTIQRFTIPAQIEWRHSNKQKWFFGAIEFKFEPNMTVLIKNLAQKVDFWANCRSNQDCRSICAGTVILEIQKFNSGTENYNNFWIKSFTLCNNKTICWVINLLGTILCVTICIIEKHNSFIRTFFRTKWL